jgi:hypothetical protein
MRESIKIAAIETQKSASTQTINNQLGHSIINNQLFSDLFTQFNEYEKKTMQSVKNDE